MSEPRFSKGQLAEVLQKAAELQEGRADPGAVDTLGLHKIANEAGIAEPPVRARGSWWQRLVQRLRGK